MAEPTEAETLVTMWLRACAEHEDAVHLDKHQRAELVDRIEHALARANSPGWIATSERMPECETRVLILVNGRVAAVKVCGHPHLCPSCRANEKRGGDG